MDKKILVIGDSCDDIFIRGTCSRLSPEAPVPVFIPDSETITQGMAMNVYRNLMALGMDSNIITNHHAPTKTRVIDKVSNQLIVRIDRNDDITPLSDVVYGTIDFNEYTAVVISDYNKGFLNEERIRDISKKHPLVFLDTKKRFGDWASGIGFIKINEREYNDNILWLKKRDGIIVTMGNRGAVLNHSVNFPIKKEHPVRDLSGAGDTFLAALVSKYIDTWDMAKAINFANECAAWVVTQKGVVAVSLEKMEYENNR